jgi:hypothetical protein
MYCRAGLHPYTVIHIWLTYMFGWRKQLHKVFRGSCHRVTVTVFNRVAVRGARERGERVGLLTSTSRTELDIGHYLYHIIAYFLLSYHMRASWPCLPPYHLAALWQCPRVKIRYFTTCRANASWQCPLPYHMTASWQCLLCYHMIASAS